MPDVGFLNREERGMPVPEKKPDMQMQKVCRYAQVSMKEKGECECH